MKLVPRALLLLGVLFESRTLKHKTYDPLCPGGFYLHGHTSRQITNKFLLQSFGSTPYVFVSAKYSRSTKPNDAVYVWLENVNSGGFEVCIREFSPFDGKHQDTTVVSNHEPYVTY